jgi:hypothetical protein
MHLAWSISLNQTYEEPHCLRRYESDFELRLAPLPIVSPTEVDCERALTSLRIICHTA